MLFRSNGPHVGDVKIVMGNLFIVNAVFKRLITQIHSIVSNGGLRLIFNEPIFRILASLFILVMVVSSAHITVTLQPLMSLRNSISILKTLMKMQKMRKSLLWSLVVYPVKGLKFLRAQTHMEILGS